VRDGEAEFLVSLLEGLGSSDCRVVEISGDPGAGKTHLFDHIEDRAAELGVPVSRHMCAPAPQPSSFHPTTLTSAPPGHLVLVDDFQHADPAAVEAFHEFLRHRPSYPLLVVVAHRPRQTPLRLRSVLAGAARLGRLDRVELSPLSVQQAAAMLRMPPEDSRVRRWHEASDGIPLYLGVLADQSVTPEPFADTRRHRTAALEEIAALHPDDVGVLAAAAVLGQDIDVSTLAAVAEVDTAAASVSLDRLVNADLLRRLGGGEIVLRHRVLGELIHDSLDQGFRTRAHRRAAEVLFRRGASAAVCAGHVEHCVPILPGGDTDVLVAAATQTLWSDPVAAARWLELARRADPRDARTELLLAKALLYSGRLQESRELSQRLLVRLPSSAHRVAAVATCALTEHLLGLRAEARARLIAELAGTTEDDQVELHLALALVDTTAGSPVAPARTRAAVRAARERGEPVLVAAALAVRGLCLLVETDIGDSDAAATEAAEIIDRLDDESLLPFLPHLGMLASTEKHLGRFADAERHVRRALDLAHAAGHHYVQPGLLATMSSVSLRIDPADKAAARAREARRAAERLGMKAIATAARSVEASAMTLLSAPEDQSALRLAEETAGPPGRHVDEWAGNPVFTLAQTALRAGDALRCLAVVTAAHHDTGLSALIPITRPLWLEMLTEAAVVSGNADAGRFAEFAARTAEQLGVEVPATAYATAARAHVLRSTGKQAEAAQAYRVSGERFRAFGMVHEQARMLLHAAECADGDEAWVLLSAVRELSRRSRARRFEHLADRMSAEPPKPVVPASWSQKLTERELQIATMAATGAPTREIARELELSPRTVEVHLSRVYRKLEVNSRAALVRLALT
jgi:DNA-binding NarL/FixJ family response regulator